MKSEQLHKVDYIERVLKEYEIDLGEEKDRWLTPLQHIDFNLSREVNRVPLRWSTVRQVDLN